MTANAWWVVRFEFQRVQSYLFAVSDLKSMVGANTLLGEVLRGRLIDKGDERGFARRVASREPEIARPLSEHKAADADSLPALAVQCGAALPEGVDAEELGPRSAAPGGWSGAGTSADLDDPVSNYRWGVLARDGGHLNAAFPSIEAAGRFVEAARRLVARRLPGLLVECRVYELRGEAGKWSLVKDGQGRPKQAELPRLKSRGGWEQPFHLPQFQVCNATGLVPASRELKKRAEGEREWISEEVYGKRRAAERFARGESFDVLGVLRGSILGALGLGESSDRERAFATEFERIAPSGYLAVIAADGNGIGSQTSRIEQEGEQAGRDFFEREARIERFHHGNRMLVRQALLSAIQEAFGPFSRRLPLPFRVLMLGGDDLLLVCDASLAMPFLIAFEAAVRRADRVLRERERDRPPFTFGAGVAVVKRTFPFHRAHELAEQLVSSAKRLYREQFESGGQSDASGRPPVSTVDWLAISEAWHDELKEVRRRDYVVRWRVKGTEETLVLSGKPYPISNGNGVAGEGRSSLAGLWELAKNTASREVSVARSQLNSLARALNNGRRRAEWAAQAVRDEALDGLLTELHGRSNPWVEVDGGVFVTRFLDFLELTELARRKLGLTGGEGGERREIGE